MACRVQRKVNLVLFSFIAKIAYLADGLFKYKRALFRGMVLRGVVLRGVIPGRNVGHHATTISRWHF